MADSVSSVLVIVLNASIYICINWTLTKLYDTSVLELPFFRVDRNTERLSYLLNITQPGFTPRQSLVSESTHLTQDRRFYALVFYSMTTSPYIPPVWQTSLLSKLT